MWTKEKLIESCQETVEDVIQNQLENRRYKYLIRELDIPKNTNIYYNSTEIRWDKENLIEKEQDDYFSLFCSIPFYAKGNVVFINLFDGQKNTRPHEFKLIIDMWFHFDENKPLFSFDILDKTKILLKDYNEKIWLNSDNLGIKSLIDRNQLFDGKTSTEFFISITGMTKNLPVPFSDFDAHDDIVMCHQDIVFSIGELICYRPYISDFTLNAVNVNGKVIFQYFPNFCDKRYLSTCSTILDVSRSQISPNFCN